MTQWKGERCKDVPLGSSKVQKKFPKSVPISPVWHMHKKSPATCKMRSWSWAMARFNLARSSKTCWLFSDSRSVRRFFRKLCWRIKEEDQWVVLWLKFWFRTKTRSTWEPWLRRGKQCGLRVNQGLIKWSISLVDNSKQHYSWKYGKYHLLLVSRMLSSRLQHKPD